MRYEIDEVSHVAGTDHNYYVLVRFWPTEGERARGDEPLVTEDFVMQLSDSGVRAILDGAGDPTGATSVYQRDVPAEIIANIERYITRAEAKGYRGNRTSQQIPRDSADPRSVLARADVHGLRGQRRTR